MNTSMILSQMNTKLLEFFFSKRSDLSNSRYLIQGYSTLDTEKLNQLLENHNSLFTNPYILSWIINILHIAHISLTTLWRGDP